jgi:hypothetical protein
MVTGSDATIAAHAGLNVLDLNPPAMLSLFIR